MPAELPTADLRRFILHRRMPRDMISTGDKRCAKELRQHLAKLLETRAGQHG